MLNLLKKHYEKILLICTAKNWEHYPSKYNQTRWYMYHILMIIY